MSNPKPYEAGERLALLGGSPCQVDPVPAWPVVDESDQKAMLDVLESRTWGGYHPAVSEFEKRFAAFHGAAFGIATANGTVSLEIALQAAGIRPGDEVIVPSITFIASATAIVRVGAVPVFVDIDPQNLNANPASVEASISERTRGIILVHFAGCPADLDQVMELCRQHNLVLIEDCAHAHGAEWKSRRVGSFGHFGSFSFQASKNMTAGEGGILITGDPELAGRARSITNQGRREGGEWYEHVALGTNARLTGFQAALLLNQLDRLPNQIGARMKTAARLRAGLSEIGGLTPTPDRLDGRVTAHSYHLFSMRFDGASFGGVAREKVLEALRAEGVPATSGYPVPIYRQKVFQSHAHRVEPCPEAEAYCDSAVWLPHNLLLADEEFVGRVLAAVEKVRRCAKQLL